VDVTVTGAGVELMVTVDVRKQATI